MSDDELLKICGMKHTDAELIGMLRAAESLLKISGRGDKSAAAATLVCFAMEYDHDDQDDSYRVSRDDLASRLTQLGTVLRGTQFNSTLALMAIADATQHYWISQADGMVKGMPAGWVGANEVAGSSAPATVESDSPAPKKHIEPFQPPPATVESDSPAPTDPISFAIAHLADHPEKSIRRLSRDLKIDYSKLQRSERLKAVIQALKPIGKGKIKKGSKSKDGTIEAEDDPDNDS